VRWCDEFVGWAAAVAAAAAAATAAAASFRAYRLKKGP